MVNRSRSNARPARETWPRSSKWPVSSHVGWETFFYLMSTARARVTATQPSTRMIHTGAISCCFTNTSTAKRAAAAGRVIKPAGRRSQQNYWRTRLNTLVKACRSIANPGPTRPRYAARLARSVHEVRRAQQLRFEVFNLEIGEGLAESYATGLDVDPFDEFCDHLIVEEVATEMFAVVFFSLFALVQNAIILSFTRRERQLHTRAAWLHHWSRDRKSVV